MVEGLTDIGFMTFILAGVAYFALAIYLMLKKQNTYEGFWLTIAMVISGIWSLGLAALFFGYEQANYFISFLEILRGSSWIIFLSLLLSRIWNIQDNQELGKKIKLFLFPFLAFVLCVSLLEAGFYLGLYDVRPPQLFSIYTILFLCIIIFLLAENLYRNSAIEALWGIKLLLVVVVSLYIYDFLLFADMFLFNAIGGKLFEARGIINFIIAPLLAISISRNPNWKLNIKVSRKVAFHTITLLGTGAYLIGMSTAGYVLQNFGGKWGDLLQVTFVLVALLGFIIFITSGRFRALTNVLLSKHFFQYRYDYREEWLKFIQTISATGEHYVLRERVIKTLADVMDSTGGALWLREQPDVFQSVARWNFQYDTENDLPSDDPFIKFLEAEEWVVDLNNDLDKGSIEKHNIKVPEWLLDNDQFWLILPLIHRGKLVGFVILLQPRVKNNLNWESTDLLKTIGRQVASYLAEQVSEIALAESREFESFNRKFAFVVHDIKNLTSQLSLIVKNAKKHSNNPEFQKDMLLTVQDSVEKMNGLLSRISVVQEPAKEKTDKSLNICRMMDEIVQGYSKRGLTITLKKQNDDLNIIADEETIETIMMHLIENAREACEEDEVSLKIELSQEGGFVIIKVNDNGHGMSQDFIRNELFRPFRSTKENGYGIGAYESREMIKRLGGRLDVKSKKDVGTTMKIYMPIAENI